jgi:hypothetical protein
VGQRIEFTSDEGRQLHRRESGASDPAVEAWP